MMDGPDLIEQGFDTHPLSAAAWLKSDFAAPDFLLGEIVSTTTRSEVIAPTGLGKTHFCMALGCAIAAGAPFLHWRAGEGPRRVLYIDGEMSRRLMRRRIEDTVRRHGAIPDTFFILSREQFPEMPPINTPEGQRFIDHVIDLLGGVDLIIFDNVQALLVGDMKEAESWEATLPWIRGLTLRAIGQLWVHHTGHDETRGYGTKTREWQLDTVMMMERLDRPGADIAFTLKFTKARERSPENRSDFADAVIMLQDDRWASEISAGSAPARRAKDRALDLLIDAVAREGKIPPASEHIPAGTPCVPEALWRAYCEKGNLSAESPDATRKAFKRAADRLIKEGAVGKWETAVWPVRK